jgi:hypothetical protein
VVKNLASGYEDLDSLVNQQNNLLQQQEQKQNDLINQQTQMQVDELNREKEKLDKETSKTTQGLYSSYQKQANQYGAGMEQLAMQGLGNSGYAETTRTSLYNAYQKSVTDTLNNANDLKADYDFKIQQARQNGSIQQAQSALELYAQKIQLLTQNYQLRQDREQYLYQQQRDQISDQQWQKSFDEQVRQNELENQYRQQQFEYQKQRDQVADSQWQQQFNLQKKNLAKSSSRSSSRKSSSSSTNKVNTGNSNSNKSSRPSAEEVVKNIKLVNNQGPGLSAYVIDGLTGKKYNKAEDILKAYGIGYE